VTGVLVVATTASGFVALDRRESYHRALAQPELPFSEKASLHERASDAERTATLFGVASLLAAGTTAVTYLIRPNARAAVGVQVSPAGGASLAAVSGRF
jgi:hypothetical protein